MRTATTIRRATIVAVSLLAILAGSVAARTNGPELDAARSMRRGNDRASSSIVFVGTVQDARSLKPIDQVQILIDGQTVHALTDVRGRYTFTLQTLTRGANVTMRARRLGYEDATQRITIRSDTVATTFAMNAAVLRLSEVTTAAQAPSPSSPRASHAVTGNLVDMSSSALSGNAAGVSITPAQSPTRWAARDKRVREERLRDERVRAEGEVRGNREQYDRIEDNPFLGVKGNPFSTFSVDVDRASYGNVRRMLAAGNKPPADAVRIEEFINYFPYALSAPRGADPIAITTEVALAPWQTKHQLVRIALKARDIETSKLPPSNLVFLIDVSGSMDSPDKLPLVQASLRLLVDQLREQDRVAIVVYAGSAGLVLPSTSGVNKATIAEAIDRLQAGGSTAGGEGIQLAYKVARENFMRAGNNRVILATDGDFNVGASSDGEMERLIEAKRAEGTYLTVLGFGTGNIQDAKMEKLAKKGNGNYAYVDDISEARKTLVHEMGATLVTVANDVKLQVEFNPSVVASYRLIGYEDRLLRDEDFADDKKDAGDVGAGHSVTALYEIVPVGVTGTTNTRTADELRYTTPAPDLSRQKSDELLYVKLRYKRPGESTSVLMTRVVKTSELERNPSDDFRFVASVASFGMLLRNSEYRGTSNAASVLEMAKSSRGKDAGAYRAEFVSLVERWERMNRVAENSSR